MAINPNILLQGIVPDIAGSVAKGLQVGQEIKNAPIRNRLLQLQEQDALAAQQQNKMKAAIQQMGVLSAAVGDKTAADLSNPDVYNDVMSQLSSVNFPLQDQNNPNSPNFVGYEQAGQNLFRAGEMSRKLSPEKEDKPLIVKEGDTVVDPNTMEVRFKSETTDKNLDEIRKETRSRLRTDLTKLSQEAAVVDTNYNKLKNLTVEVGKGNRSAVAQALVALVKLGDPTSVVKDSEMVAALNKENPVAAVASLLSDKGTSDDVVNAVSGRIDALNPDNVNVEELMATANAMVSANVPAIQARFEEAQNLASSNLTQSGINSLFTKGFTDRITGLSGLVAQQQQTPQAAQVKEGQTATNPETGERIIFRGGQWQKL